MRTIIAMLLSVLLIGCATTPGQDILVPVATNAEPPVLKRPYLPIWNLEYEDDSELVVRAYYESLLMQMTYSRQLECYLDAYRVETPKQCIVQKKEDDQ